MKDTPIRFKRKVKKYENNFLSLVVEKEKNEN